MLDAKTNSHPRGWLFVLWFVVQKTKGVIFFRKKGFSERREAV